MARTFTLRPDSYEVQQKMVCPYCENTFADGEQVTLVPTAPGNAEEAAKMRAGRAYNAIAAVLHLACAQALRPGEYTGD